MTILITGATGLVGQSLVKLLIKSPGYSTTPEMIQLLIRKKPSDPYRRDFITWCKSKRIQIINGDLGCFEDIDSFTTVPDPENSVLIHCGAIFNFWQPYKLLYNINVKGTERILKIFHQKKIGKLIYLSSAVVYKSIAGNGIRGVVEDDPIGKVFRKNYERTKLLGELIIKRYITKHPERAITILRPSGIIGGASSTLDIFGRLFIGRFIPLPNGGKDKISLVDTDDVARAIIHFSNFSKGNGQEFNVVSFTPNLKELVVGLANSFEIKNPVIIPVPLSLFKPLYYLSIAIRKVKSATEKSFLLPILFEKLGQDVWIDNCKIINNGYEFKVTLDCSLAKVRQFIKENPWYVDKKFGFAL